MTTHSTTNVHGWLSGRLPDDWFQSSPDISIDKDEIVIVGELDTPTTDDDATDADRAAAVAGRIKQFREDTRDRRIQVARELEHATGTKVAWGVRIGDTRELFTNASVPVMTRLRQPERHVLDTLVEAGVARSRSDAMAWCVRLVAQHSDTWLADLRKAMEAVQKVRAQGPTT